MEYIKTFLETSTIHGLTYISKSKKNTRIFWIFVVVAGFSVAGIMIYESAKTWAENPVRTTIETLPIGRIKKYPTVTVCPPQNTYTNLNYDLMMLENMTLDNNIREELLNNSKVLYNDHLYDQVMKSLNKLQDNDRYYNWYYGFTKIEIPSETYELEAYWGYSYYQSYLHYFMTTYALSGMVATKGFQEKLNVNMVDTNIDYQLEFWVPSNLQNIGNATLAVDIEKVAVEGTGTDVLSFNNEKIIYDKLSKNITLTERKQKVTLTLKRFANLVQKTKSSTDVWKILKDMKAQQNTWSNPELCNHNKGIGLYDVSQIILPNIISLEQQLKVKYSEIIFENMSRDTLETAAKMFLFLNSCSEFLETWLSFYTDLFMTKAPDQIVLALNRIMKHENKNRDGKIALELFKKVTKLMNLKYEKIDKIINGRMKISSIEEKKFFNDISRVSNHPVHLIDKDGELLPSALIPFCDFGGRTSLVANDEVDQFEVPICTCFKEKIFNDRHCYAVDLNEFYNKDNIENELKLGFAFTISHNADRQVTFDDEQGLEEEQRGLINKTEYVDPYISTIYLNTIDPLDLNGEGEYNIKVIKEIEVTESFLSLEKQVKGCQNEEPFENCTTRHYLQTVLKKCKCLPFDMMLAEKEPLCDSEGIKCAKSIKIDFDYCQRPCSGYFVTSFSRNPKKYGSFNSFRSQIEERIADEINTYKIHTKWFPIPKISPGKLKYVRIFYDTPSFDKIRKDRAAKFVDKFSSIGGTMGLLTGFSVISGVEIIYFLCKIVFNIISKKRVSDEE